MAFKRASNYVTELSNFEKREETSLTFSKLAAIAESRFLSNFFHSQKRFQKYTPSNLPEVSGRFLAGDSLVVGTSGEALVNTLEYSFSEKMKTQFQRN